MTTPRVTGTSWMTDVFNVTFAHASAGCKRLGVDLGRYRRKSLTFARVEAGLIRRRHELAAAQRR